MRHLITFEVDTDEAGIAAYKAAYPDFDEEEYEDVRDLLVREAIANWEFEGLIREAKVMPEKAAVAHA